MMTAQCCYLFFLVLTTAALATHEIWMPLNDDVLRAERLNSVRTASSEHSILIRDTCTCDLHSAADLVKNSGDPLLLGPNALIEGDGARPYEGVIMGPTTIGNNPCQQVSSCLLTLRDTSALLFLDPTRPLDVSTINQLPDSVHVVFDVPMKRNQPKLSQRFSN
eukprot:Blabericola_migrator_1__10084@NODE_55_length_16001_cov_154_094327_g51_i0_p11_GENE_NODE_55_length_16001_cov_154_094327_g51_i0NODE_55_length_16001_cov_154_094327_g51_i0_p11_ORF_typecomplete_len164_score19_01_NODE_55_length_16001_cov_154_094327_g51_i01355014041